MDDQLLRDERWDRLAAGTLTAEEETDLKALATSSPEAMEAYLAFKPLGAEFQARVVSAINSQQASEAPAPQAEDTADLVRRALDGNPTAQNRLVAVLTPVIQACVARTLLAHRSSLASGRDLREEVKDQTQGVFLALFDRDGHVLRTWQADRGLSLKNFVGLVAKCQVLSFLRNGRRNPWKEEPSFDEYELDIMAADPNPEDVTISREQLSLLLDRLNEELSPLGWRMFLLLIVQELSQEEVQKKTGLSADAVYAWRSRLRRRAQKLLAEMS